MDRPFFTAIVPVHDDADCVARAVESVFAQTEPDFELLVVDDGSTDETPDVLRSFSDPRMRVLRQPASGTPAGARNAGIRQARGAFVAFLDADDHWAPEKLARVRTLLESSPDLDLVCHGVDLMSRGRRRGQRLYRLWESLSLYEQLLYRGNFLTTSATVVRTERLRELGGMDPSPERRIGEDLDLWLRLAESGSRAAILPEILGVYRVGEGVSADPGAAFASTFALLDPRYEALAREGRLDVRRALVRRARARVALARACLARGNPAAGAASLLVLPFELFVRHRRYARLRRSRG